MPPTNKNGKRESGLLIKWPTFYGKEFTVMSKLLPNSCKSPAHGATHTVHVHSNIP